MVRIYFKPIFREEKIMNPDFEAAKKRLEQIKNSNKLYQNKNNKEMGDIFFKPSEEKKTIRILPRSDWPTPMFEAAYHFNIGGQKVFCPQKNLGDECPICDFHKKLRLAKDTKSNQVESRWTYTAVILERKKDGSFDKPKLWSFSSGKMYEDFVNKLGDEDYNEYTSFGAKGWDWKVQKVQNTNPNAFTPYRLDCVPFKQSVVTEDPEELIKIQEQIVELETFYTEKLLKPQSTSVVTDIFNDWAEGTATASSESEAETQEKLEEIVNNIDFSPKKK